MGKIMCPECGREKKENDTYCLDCGYVFKEEDLKEIKKEETKENIKTSSYDKTMYINPAIVALTIIYLACLYKVPMIISHYSGKLSLLNFTNVYLHYLNIGSIYKYALIAVIVLLIFNAFFVFINNVTRKIARAFYLLTFIFELLYFIVISGNEYQFIYVSTFFVFIIPLIMFILLVVNKNNKPDNNKKDYMNKIKELKELYDSEIINKEEFEKYKKEILDKEMK